MEKRIHPLWWLWLPLGYLVLQIIMELTLSDDFMEFYVTEDGPLELLHAVLGFLGFGIAVCAIWKLRRSNPYMTGWFVLAALGCLYVGGEEVSWGQHIFEWTSSEFWMHINDQGETNLHNTSSWLDQKPRLILLAGVLGGGIILPLLRRFQSSLIPERFEPIYPPTYLCWIAVILAFIYLLNKLEPLIGDIVMFHRGSEVEELYMLYYVVLYLIDLKKRHT